MMWCLNAGYFISYNETRRRMYDYNLQKYAEESIFKWTQSRSEVARGTAYNSADMANRRAIDHCYANELTNPQMTHPSRQLKMGVNEASNWLPQFHQHGTAELNHTGSILHKGSTHRILIMVGLFLCGCVGAEYDWNHDYLPSGEWLQVMS